MSFKHQGESYRTRNGIRYECDGDILDKSLGDLRKQASDRVRELRSDGRAAFFEKHDGGSYYRVFAASGDGK
jgi:hypothetical protein